MKINNFDNPIFIFTLCLFSVVINLISSIYFFPIFLLGILFLAFIRSIRNRYGYSSFFVILSIFLIELNNGFMPFSIVMLSFFIYAFIIPYLKRILSIENIKLYVYVAVFYFGLYVLWVSNNESTIQLNYTLLMNLLFDFILIGLLS